MTDFYPSDQSGKHLAAFQLTQQKLATMLSNVTAAPSPGRAPSSNSSHL